MPRQKYCGEMVNQRYVLQPLLHGGEHKIASINTYLYNTRKPKEHIKDIKTIMEVNLPH